MRWLWRRRERGREERGESERNTSAASTLSPSYPFAYHHTEEQHSFSSSRTGATPSAPSRCR